MMLFFLILSNIVVDGSSTDCKDASGPFMYIGGTAIRCDTFKSSKDSVQTCNRQLQAYGGTKTYPEGFNGLMTVGDVCPELFKDTCTTCATGASGSEGSGESESTEIIPASSHGDPIIHTFNGECYDLNKDGLYLASSHADWGHNVKVAVYNNFIREVQITDQKDDALIFSFSNMNESVGEWPFGLEHRTRMCQEFSWKECDFSHPQTEFDAQVFRYYVQIQFHDYLDPALEYGQRGMHLDIFPVLYTKHKAAFRTQKSEYTGIYFENPLPEELDYCPVH